MGIIGIRRTTAGPSSTLHGNRGQRMDARSVSEINSRPKLAVETAMANTQRQIIVYGNKSIKICISCLRRFNNLTSIHSSDFNCSTNRCNSSTNASTFLPSCSPYCPSLSPPRRIRSLANRLLFRERAKALFVFGFRLLRHGSPRTMKPKRANTAERSEKALLAFAREKELNGFAQ